MSEKQRGRAVLVAGALLKVGIRNYVWFYLFVWAIEKVLDLGTDLHRRCEAISVLNSPLHSHQNWLCSGLIRMKVGSSSIRIVFFCL